MEIDITFKTHLQGKYNKIVTWCPFCDNDMCGRLLKHAKGFSDTEGGTMIIIECDACYETFFFHAGEESYDNFLDIVDQGDNIFFKP